MINHEDHTLPIARHGRTTAFTHPDDVLLDREMSVEEKRAILADWASDAHAVPDRPALRQLDSGAIVPVDDVLTALRTLDEPQRAHPSGLARRPFGTPRPRLPFRVGLHKFRRWRDGHDDDDPPPCPASALPPGVELALRRRRDAVWAAAA